MRLHPGAATLGALPLALALAVSTPAPAQQPARLGAATTRRAVPDDTRPVERTPVSFWAVLGDTTLERLLGDALRANHDVRGAAARVDGARAARAGATLDLVPAVTASGGYTRQQLASPAFPGASGTLPDQGLWDAGLRLSWDLDVFGGIRRTVEGRGALVESAREDLSDVRVLVTSELAGAYFELRGAQDRLAVARRNAENQRGTLDVTLQRLEGGRGTALDSERAQAQLSATLAEIPALEATIAAARHRIGVLTGRSPDALAVEPGGDVLPVALPDALPVADADSLVRDRPDVRSAEQRVAASTAFVGAARAEYLPHVSIGGAAGYTGTTVGSFGDTGTPRYVIGPVISWPAFDLGRVRAGVEEAQAAQAEAEARYEGAVLRAASEVETSLITYRKARERLRHLEAAAAASERAAELARLRYTEGASDFLQVLDAERTLLEAQDRRALGRTAATTALVRVFRATGGAWPLVGDGDG